MAEDIAQRDISGVRVMTDIGDPATILESWAGARLAVVVDAAMGDGGSPGRIRRWTPGEEDAMDVVTSHAMGLPQAYALGEALGQIPDRLVILSIDIADADYGVGLTPRVAATVPGVVEAVLAELAGDLRRPVRD